MKPIKSFIAISAATLLLAGCADLDTTTPSQLSSSNMWTTADLAESGVAGIYRVFYPEYGNYDNGMFAIGRNRVETCGFTSDNTPAMGIYFRAETPSPGDDMFSKEWKYCYEGVSAANDAIANLSKATDLTEKRLHQLTCESKFLRAWFYARLNQLYQGVPLYLEPVANEDCTKGASTADEVWDAILNDLNDCINDQYMNDNNLSGDDYGRPSKGSAYALRGMVYMWKKDYQKASDDFEAVKRCGFDLWKGEYLDEFKEANERNSEMIFPIQFKRAATYGDLLQRAFGNRSTLSSSNKIIPNTDFVNSYENADGSKFEFSQIFPDWDKLTVAQREVFFVRDGMNSNTNSDFANQRTAIIGRVGQDIWDKYYLDDGNQARMLKAYSCRDPRLMQTIFAPGATYPTCSWTGNPLVQSTTVWPYLSQSYGDMWHELRNIFYYGYRKFVVADDPTATRDQIGTDWPLMRYTECLLKYAEAQNELGNIDKAIEAINKIRNRAHMPALTNGGTGANAVQGQDDMRERIRYEARVELTGEGVNFFDEVRWGTWKQSKFQGQNLHGVPCVWGKAEVEQYYHDYLWPWPKPLEECQRNPNLQQTPGWTY